MKRIFITGGASGLGRALAECAARDGWRVCIGDVNEQRLEETLEALNTIASAGHLAVRCDVREIADLQEVADVLTAEWGGVDTVVNNAGVAIGGPIDEVPFEDFEWIVDINLMGVVRGCKVFVPLLKKQGSGHIVNIASLAGLVHLPMMTAYNTTKAGVVALSETLRIELRKHKIDVSVVCPSFFRTNLAESMRDQGTASSKISHSLITKAKYGADEIAAIVWRGMQRRDLHVLPHTEGKLFWAMKRMAPLFFSKLVGRAARRAESKIAA